MRLIGFLFCIIVLFLGDIKADNNYHNLYPTLCLGIGVRNHSHILPYSLGLIENLKYPKDKVHVHIIGQLDSDDETVAVAKRWSAAMSSMYLSSKHTEKHGNWMEALLEWARGESCQYLFVTDGDNFLMPNTLRELLNLKVSAVSAFLEGPFGKRSNVHDLLDLGFIKREDVKTQQVYYFNSPFLLHLADEKTAHLTFDPAKDQTYKGNNNPRLVFAHSAYSANIPLFVDNREFYGYILDSIAYPPSYHKKLLSYFLASLVSNPDPMPLPQSSALEPWYPPSTQLGFDQIYIVNLKRRPGRLQKMDLIMRLLGIKYTVFEAVDGKALTNDDFVDLRFLPDYLDPFAKRPMTTGEVGCFLSHYRIWEDVVRNGFDRVIIFEDDIRFAEDSTIEIAAMIEDIMKTQLEWDLIYLGRKKMTPQGDEFYLPGHRYLSTVAYSYWTLGYALSQTGAQKLIDARPLERLLALDEFLPIMYDKHPNPQWSQYFSPRNLKAFAMYPVVVTPERYTHEAGYISDTEASSVIQIG